MARRGRRTLYTSIAVVALLALVAAAAPLLVPFAPNEPLDIVNKNSLAPSFAHPFGTDPRSRDVLSRVLYGARISLWIAGASVAVALVVGSVFGAVAALAGGLVDGFMMRVLDILMAIPRLLILVAITALATPFPLPLLILVLGLTGWYDIARLVRGELHGLMMRDFVLAAAASGVPRRRLLLRHLFPHLLPILSVSASLGVANSIALEAGLGYLGLGVQAPTASWGSILHDGMGRVETQWWLTLFPALATAIAVVACNALGDALRDVFAPEQVPA